MDLFDASPVNIPAAPVPWSDAAGFLTSEPWRAYCEAWGFVIDQRRGTPPLGLTAVERHRGKAGVLQLTANARVVEDDLAGRVMPRSRLSSLVA